MKDLSEISLSKRLNAYWNLMRANIIHQMFVGSYNTPIKFTKPYVELETFDKDGLVCCYKVTEINKGKCTLLDRNYTVDLNDLDMNEIHELLKYIRDDEMA